MIASNSHYKKKVEPIELIESFDLNFNLGNVIKYVSRSNYKHDNPIADLQKALYYLEREISIQKSNAIKKQDNEQIHR